MKKRDRDRDTLCEMIHNYAIGTMSYEDLIEEILNMIKE